MKRKVLFLIGLVVIFSQVNSQSLMQEFNKLLSKNDTTGQLELLLKWETSTTSDPDLYVAFFNYYFKKSMKEVIRFGKKPKGKNSKQVLDTLTKEPIGYMNSEIYYKPDDFNHGVEYINKGIEKFPARLVASRVATVLNEYFGNTYVANDHDIETVRQCMTCHGDKGKLVNASSKMGCTSCHTESIGHKLFADIHYKIMKAK